MVMECPDQSDKDSRGHQCRISDSEQCQWGLGLDKCRLSESGEHDRVLDVMDTGGAVSSFLREPTALATESCLYQSENAAIRNHVGGSWDVVAMPGGIFACADSRRSAVATGRTELFCRGAQ